MAKKSPSFASVKKGYGNLWAKAAIRDAKAAEANEAADYIIKHRARYEKVAERIGAKEVWPLIGALHWREAAGSFSGILHNGQHIIGTGRKTTLEPKNRGPFSSWEEAAVDALVLKGWHRITDWYLIERWLYQTEPFNGWGYFLYRDENSPYLWAATNLQEYGKYTSDGNFDRSAWDKQLGVVAILKAIFAKQPELAPKGSTGLQVTPAIATATVTAPAIVVAASQGDHGFVAGASIAFVFLLAAWVQQQGEVLRTKNKGNTMNLGYIFKNGKTTALGVAGVLGGLGTLITMLANGNYDPTALMGVAGSIATGIGLIVAKDGNVTGGTKPNA